jgi:hypothetical protein
MLNNLCCFDIVFIGVGCLLGGENSADVMLNSEELIGTTEYLTL